MPDINRCGMIYTDKVVIITGGSKGIGEGCARVFTDAGTKVAICARDIKAGEELAKELNSKGPGTCHFIRCDVSKPEEIKNLVDRTIELYGRIDCLINNAGYHPGFKSIDGFSLKDFQDILQTNLISYFVACKFALPHLRKTKGNIINMGSLAGIIGQEGGTIYSATKGAISSFTKSLAIEEARYAVRVNCISPGNILSYNRITGVAASENPEALNKLIDSWQPTGRSGINEEVGQLCLFLASHAASYITGIDVIISGGSELGYGIKYPLTFLKDKRK